MASSSFTSLQKYEVFLSFRGEDTRNSFVSHLYAALNQKEIKTFFDEEDLEKGQKITPKLLKSIEESKFAIIIFSKNYLSSTWCLDELVKIMECRSKYSLTVIPIFYNINPSDIRKQNNSFADFFTKHEVKFKDNLEKVQIWKDNLREAANISGHDFRNVPEAPLISKVVEEIFNKLPLKSTIEGLFGIENRLKELRSLLAREPNDVRFVGIWGMGGIGKTTTARAIFHELINEFEGGCFLQDVNKKGIVDLQNTLLSKVLRSPVNTSDEQEGSTLIRDRVSSKRVLVVLDDVNDINQLDSLARSSKWFGNGSRIIITTRDKHLLNDVNELYKIETLYDNEALELFCWHAFRKSHPAENFVQLSDRVVGYSGGLPLALKILGSHLRGRQENVWKYTIDRLKDDPDKNIIATLKISFDGLSDTQQNIFLDMACLFRGDQYKLNQKLDSFGFYPVVGIPDLIDKSLVHISDGHIQMHDLIHEMGLDVVRQKAHKKPERYSRLWDVDDIIDVLTKGTGTSEVEALVLWHARYEKIDLNKGAFKNMNMLRLLDLDGETLVGAPNYLPNSLRWLSWSFYPGKSLPRTFQPKNLVNLDLCSSLTLRKFPKICCMPNLEYLNLSRCIKLLEVPPSVAVHKKLIHLDLSYCEKLKKFPSTIQMESLETLNLSHCYGLKILPEFHKNMLHLRTLHLYYTRIKILPQSVEGLKGLREISISTRYDSSFYECKNAMLTLLLSLPLLQKVDMQGCNLSEIILPKSIGCLTSLQELDLSGNEIVSLPENIKRFSSLRVLRLMGSKMTELPQISSSIMELDLDRCTELTWIPHPVDLLDKYENLLKLSLGDCKQIASQFLLASYDWEALTNRLYKRQEVLQLIFPCTETFRSLCGEEGNRAWITLSPSWYNDKFRGFAIFAISKKPDYRVGAIDDIVTIIPYTRTYRVFNTDQAIVLYIPIGKITSGRNWNEQKECCLLQVINNGPIKSWGIRLVYEGDIATKDIGDLIIVNHDVETTKYKYSSALMEVCATAPNQIQ